MGILYNITYNVDESISAEWLNWMKTYYIQEIVSTKYFESAKMVKILVEEEMGGVSYAVMYSSPSLEALEGYMENMKLKFDKKLVDKYGEKVLTFMTLLEEELDI